MMTDKSKTKLLKMVCKRAELMRAPFRDSSWTSNITQTDKKKPLLLNKTEEKYGSNVTESNVEKTCSSVHKVCNSEKYNLHLRIFF